MELVKKQLKKHHSGQEHEKLQQLLQRMVSGSELQVGGENSSSQSGGGSRSLLPTHLTHLLFASQEQQEMAQQERRRQQELRLALKQEQRARAQQGHRPYFLKKCEWGTAIPGWLQGQAWVAIEAACCVGGPGASLRQAQR